MSLRIASATTEFAYSLSYNFVSCVDMPISLHYWKSVSLCFDWYLDLQSNLCVCKCLGTTFNSVAAFLPSSGSASKSCSVLATIFTLAFGSVAASVETSDGPVSLFMSSQLYWPSALLGIQSACPKMLHHSHRPECRQVFWPSPLLGFGALC